MERFSAHDLQRDPGSVQEAAFKAPVAITYDGRDGLIIMTAEEYARLNRGEQRAYLIEDLPNEWVELLKESYSDPEQDALNNLLDAEYAGT